VDSALLRLASSLALDTSAVPGRVLLPLSESSGAPVDSSLLAELASSPSSFSLSVQLLAEEALDDDDDDDDDDGDEDPSLS
jgi:hypothetical protein